MWLTLSLLSTLSSTNSSLQHDEAVCKTIIDGGGRAGEWYGHDEGR